MTCLNGWLGLRSSVGGVGGVLAWVACLHVYRASVGGVLTWVTWLVWQHG